MSEIQIQTVRHARDSYWHPRMVSWDQLCSMLATFDTRELKDGPGFANVIADAGTTKHKDNVRGLTLGVLDLDGDKTYANRRTGPGLDTEKAEIAAGGGIDPITFAAIVSDLERSGLAFAIHTTHTHRPQWCKARVFFRLTRNVWPVEWPLICGHLIRRFNLGAARGGSGVTQADYDRPAFKAHGPADPSIATLGRFYFWPSNPPGVPTFAGANPGVPLDVDLVIAQEQHAQVIEGAHEQITVQRERFENIEAQRHATGEPIDIEGLRNILRSSQGKNHDTIKRMLRGEALAEPGDRNPTLNRLVSAIRYSLPAETPDEAILELLRPSLSLFTSEIDPLTGKREDWIAIASEMIERHGARRRASDALRSAIAEDTWKSLRSEGSRAAEPAPRAPIREGDDAAALAREAEEEADAAAIASIEKYTPAQIAGWATEQGCQTLNEFSRRWMIQRGQATYVFSEGRYLSPVPRENLFDSLKRDLARAPVDLYVETKKGGRAAAPVASLLEAHSTVARRVEASLVLQTSSYDAVTQTFNEATTPLRKTIRPHEHSEIQLWIDLLDPTGKLTDWIATVTRLDRYTCAIYLDTKKGTGKNLLAMGLARLWTTGGPSELDRVIDGFNDSLTNCPLVFADESIPKRKDMTAWLRRFIGSTTRTLNRKHLPACPLNGAIRLIIAGNNDRLMDNGEELSVNDLAAIASRFLYLNAGDKAAGYLEALGGPPVIGKWITHDLLAEHALFLAATRKVNEGSRFLVEGDATEFHRHLATGSGMAGLVCEWITRFLAEPMSSQYVHVGESEVWINTEALAKPLAWEKYLPSSRVPSAAQIGRSLRSLSHGAGKLTIGGAQLSFHRIKAELLTTWIDRLQIGDTGAIRAKLSAPNEVIRMGGTSGA